MRTITLPVVELKAIDPERVVEPFHRGLYEVEGMLYAGSTGDGGGLTLHLLGPDGRIDMDQPLHYVWYSYAEQKIILLPEPLL